MMAAEKGETPFTTTPFPSLHSSHNHYKVAEDEQQLSQMKANEAQQRQSRPRTLRHHRWSMWMYFGTVLFWSVWDKKQRQDVLHPHPNHNQTRILVDAADTKPVVLSIRHQKQQQRIDGMLWPFDSNDDDNNLVKPWMIMTRAAKVPRGGDGGGEGSSLDDSDDGGNDTKVADDPTINTGKDAPPVVALGDDGNRKQDMQLVVSKTPKRQGFFFFGRPKVPEATIQLIESLEEEAAAGTGTRETEKQEEETNKNNSMESKTATSSTEGEGTRDSSSTSSFTSGTIGESVQEPRRLLVIGVDGGTESIRACCFDALTGQVVGDACAAPYDTRHPKPGWAEQEPQDWYDGLCRAVRDAVASVAPNNNGNSSAAPKMNYQIAAICMDTTCCSVVALDHHYKPLRPCLLWMDQRSAPQTHEMVNKARTELVDLGVNGDDNPSVSAEWMIPKALWLRQHEFRGRQKWRKVGTICEYQDYLNYRLTGVMTASACNAATRWHWNVGEAVSGSSSLKNDSSPYFGRPMALLQKLGLESLAEKWPEACHAMGQVIGNTTEQATEDLGLRQPIPVVQGGADAFVGMIGLGCVGGGGAVAREGTDAALTRKSKRQTRKGRTNSNKEQTMQPQLCLITGSSHLHCLVVPTSGSVTAAKSAGGGMWGPYQNAPLPGLAFGEGGQSSTGSLLKWAKTRLFDDRVSYQEMDNLAASLPPGSDGLVALETFQGSRTPYTDPMARGALLGLTLQHTKAHVWRALMEGVCFGTRACLEALEEATQQTCQQILLAGGIAKSPLWLQMHADVTQRPLLVFGENHNAPLLGCAILASVGGLALHNSSVPVAVSAMLPTPQTIVPNPNVAAQYNVLYQHVYSKLAYNLRPLAHAIHRVQHMKPGETMKEDEKEEIDSENKNNRTRNEHEEQCNDGDPLTLEKGPASASASNDGVTVSPSLLACDFGNIRHEVQRCLQAGVTRFHVDIFDGVALQSPCAFTFGPDMVKVIAESVVATSPPTSCNGSVRSSESEVTLDLHMCVQEPQRFVDAMAEAQRIGGDRVQISFMFQWEGLPRLGRLSKARYLANQVQEAGMKCGVSLNPNTPIEGIVPLLQTNMISVVNVLGVEPGFGGQSFQTRTLEKVSELKQWKSSQKSNFDFDILVDGGVNRDIAKSIREAGADILVSGSFLFAHERGLKDGIRELLFE